MLPGSPVNPYAVIETAAFNLSRRERIVEMSIDMADDAAKIVAAEIVARCA